MSEQRAAATGFRAWLAIFTVAVAAALSGLLMRQWLNQRDTDRELQDLRRAVCGVVEILESGPTPPPGPAGDRARAALPRWQALQRAACGVDDGILGDDAPDSLNDFLYGRDR